MYKKKIVGGGGESNNPSNNSAGHTSSSSKPTTAKQSNAEKEEAYEGEAYEQYLLNLQMQEIQEAEKQEKQLAEKSKTNPPLNFSNNYTTGYAQLRYAVSEQEQARANEEYEHELKLAILFSADGAGIGMTPEAFQKSIINKEIEDLSVFLKEFLVLIEEEKFTQEQVIACQKKIKTKLTQIISKMEAYSTENNYKDKYRVYGGIVSNILGKFTTFQVKVNESLSSMENQKNKLLLVGILDNLTEHFKVETKFAGDFRQAHVDSVSPHTWHKPEKPKPEKKTNIYRGCLCTHGTFCLAKNLTPRGGVYAII